MSSNPNSEFSFWVDDVSVTLLGVELPRLGLMDGLRTDFKLTLHSFARPSAVFEVSLLMCFESLFGLAIARCVWERLKGFSFLDLSLMDSSLLVEVFWVIFLEDEV